MEGAGSNTGDADAKAKLTLLLKKTPALDVDAEVAYMKKLTRLR